jgi:two-component system LytT family response regulator
MTLSVLVVDDEPLARERLRTLLTRERDVAEVSEAGDGNAAVEALLTHRPDVVFLDVQMPGRDGFEVMAAIGPERMPTTIFVTAYDQHAVRAFGVHAVDYLLKPFEDERFAQALARARKQQGLEAVEAAAHRLRALLAEVAPHAAAGTVTAPVVTAPAPPPSRYADRVMVKHDGRSYVVRLAEVRVIESDGNYVQLHDARTKHVIRETLTALEARLDPARFVRIHRRLIVNIDAVKELQPWFGGDQVMVLTDGTKLRVSRTYRERVAEALGGR